MLEWTTAEGSDLSAPRITKLTSEGTPIVMIHGWGPDHRPMKGCMEPIFQTSNTDWKRIYFDLPGMGKTKGDNLQIEQDTLFSETVKEWLHRVTSCSSIE
ncbi:pimeloyl-ACP methyl ester carboxylesterase [Paenibacillus sp. DS2015]|uniref:alpha/beta fold hydrolase n=1 Tax=Paenibacillus sp. DS2015 TaxID=3373917 RepID=UPI003D24B793